MESDNYSNEGAASQVPAASGSPGRMHGALPDNIAHLPTVELVAANESPLMVASSWLMLAHMATSDVGLMRSTASLVKLPKLVVLRYVGEGVHSRLFLVKDGSEERLVKLYHTSTPTTNEAEAYEILERYVDPRPKVPNLAPSFFGHKIVAYAANNGVQVRQYAVITTYIRSESISDAARKLTSQAINDLETQVKSMVNALHRAGIIHGNLTASNILLDDPTRYQSSLEFKSLSRSGVEPRFVGFSSAKFESRMDKATWDALRKEDRRNVQQIFVLVRSQNDTTAAIKLVKRLTGDEKQEKIRQRSLVRALPQADPLDNELSASLQVFSKPIPELVLSIAALFVKGNRHDIALVFLEKNKCNSSTGEPHHYVHIHVIMAEVMGKLNRPEAEIEAAWDLAIQVSKECMGLASRTTIDVRRKHSLWTLGAGHVNKGVKLFAKILTDVIAYHRRGTGNEMTEVTFVLRMRNATSDVKLRCAKKSGPMAVTDKSTRDVLEQAFRDWSEFVDAIDEDNHQKRQAEEAAKTTQMNTTKASNSLSKRPAEGDADEGGTQKNGGGVKSAKKVSSKRRKGPA